MHIWVTIYFRFNGFVKSNDKFDATEITLPIILCVSEEDAGGNQRKL